MKKRIILFSIFILLSATTYLLNAEDDLTGLQIIKKMQNANSSKIGFVTKGRLEVKNLKTGKSETRKFISLYQKKDGLERSLFRFTDSSYKGTTFLTIEKKDGSKIQYLYLKSIGSPRQIESSDKENNFLDTEIANEDLGGIVINDYTYKRLPDKEINKRKYYVVERYPKKKSKYKKVYLVIDKETLLPIMTKSYSKEGRVVKIMKSSEIVKIGNINIAKKIVITNVPEKRQTIIYIDEAKEKPINRGYFNKNRMNLKWQEE